MCSKACTKAFWRLVQVINFMLFFMIQSSAQCTAQNDPNRSLLQMVITFIIHENEDRLTMVGFKPYSKNMWNSSFENINGHVMTPKKPSPKFQAAYLSCF